jgi:hypothetical protein
MAGQRQSREQKDRAIAAAVENVLTFMTLSEIEHWETLGGKRGRLSPRYFSAAEPLILGYEVWGEQEERYLIPEDCRPCDLDTPLDLTVLAANTEAGEFEETGAFSACRTRLVKPADVRGRVRRLLPFMVDYAMLVLDGKGKATAARTLLGSADGFRWVNIDNNAQPSPHLDAFHSPLVTIQCGVAFTRQFFWGVELGWEGSPTVRIPTDALGVREVFRLRDLPEGKGRRAALRHWVEEHWRKSRTEALGAPVEELLVREHLRGATRFDWRGLVCTIHPSLYDLKREELARTRRAEARDAGTDRRLVIEAA